MTRQTIRIRRDDMVEVISGNDRGARGRVLRAIPKDRRVVVESVNIRKKHQSAVQAGRGQVQAGIIQFEAPIDVSNVMLICPNCGELTRVGLRRENSE
ncbi:MAG: 50S ribosomal protein L24, partial [Chloroflexota bacterium]